MNQNFRLPSLHLGTDFDDPILPLDVPGTLGRGSSSALCILDGANRAPHRLSRLVRPVGLLGVKLAETGVGVRVTLRLLADDLSTTMWDRHMLRQSGEPMPLQEEYVPSDVSTRHRLVEVTAQGRTRALAVLALRRSDDGTVRQHVSFELSAEEIGESGLVMVGLEDPANAPEWARRNQLEDGLVGTCVARMMVDHLDERVHAHVSTGRPSVHRTQLAAANPGFFVLNPDHDGGAVRVQLTARGSEGERLLGRRAKAKHPVRFVRQQLEERNVANSAPAAVEVVDLRGSTVLATEVAAQEGRYGFEVPAGVGPAFVRARKLIGGSPKQVNWSVKVRPARS